MTTTPRPSLLSLWLLLSLGWWMVVEGFVPPRDSFRNDGGSGSWESVHAMRRRLGLQYNFTPTLLNPEVCRYLSEEECQDADVSLQAHARQMQDLGNMMMYQSSSTMASSSWTEPETPNVGVVRVLVILLQFTDHRNRTLPDPSIYHEIWNSRVKTERIPSGSVSQWFAKNSYGLYEIEAVIVPWTLADESELYYSFGSSGLVPQLQQAFWPTLDILDQEGIDWSQYDINGDGVLDAVTVLHTGYAAELKGVDCHNDREYFDRIWSHAYATSTNSWVSFDGYYRLGGYTIASAYRDVCGYEPAQIGIVTHEFMHTMGLVDLYDGQEAQVGRGVGGFDIMANPYGPKDDPDWPGHLSAWSRIKVGWLLPMEIVQDGEYSIQASELSNQAYIIRKKFPYDEYLLIENRQPLWYDARLWTGGLVIYHIDDQAPLQTNRGYPGQLEWPRNGNHYQVAVLASDGEYNLEKGDNGGDERDFWKEGMILGPGNGRVFPNTDAYQFGSVRITGIKIYDIKSVDTVMTFRVSGLDEVATPAPAPAPMPITTKTPTPTITADVKPTKPLFSDNTDTDVGKREYQGLSSGSAWSHLAHGHHKTWVLVISILTCLIVHL